MKFAVKDVASGEVYDVITVDERSVRYETAQAKSIVETCAATRRTTPAVTVTEYLSGWSNGYLEIIRMPDLAGARALPTAFDRTEVLASTARTLLAAFDWSAHLRHPAPPPHEQWMHGKKKPRGAVEDKRHSLKEAKRSSVDMKDLLNGSHPTADMYSDISKSTIRGLVGAAGEGVRHLFEGRFAGLRTANVKAKLVNDQPNLHDPAAEVGGNRGVWVEGDILGADGRKVGLFIHILYRDKGVMTAEMRHLEITDKTVRGQGFAQQFNQHLFAKYRADGVKQVKLHADIDVGGYAWAREGYDFADRKAHNDMRDRLRITLQYDQLGYAANLPPQRRQEQLELGRQMLEGMRSGERPTPFELSQLGRWTGAGKDDWWMGKALMMGSKWDGVKRL